MEKKRTAGGEHYIDKQEFYNAYKQWWLEGYPDPIPEFIAMNFVKLANKLSNSRMFRGYSYLEDMVGDGILHCLEKSRKFNPEKFDNPFAYFTSVVVNRFKLKMGVEKYHSDGKFGLAKDLNPGISALDYSNIMKSNTDEHGDFVDHETGEVLKRTRIKKFDQNKTPPKKQCEQP